mmetsp:Transcript_108180/g.304758  ORF Transcript_108180/g.304758 Transcript_108180/m.304758 type:complete len:201 (-) Transcript_108180:61-663(-)
MAASRTSHFSLSSSWRRSATTWLLARSGRMTTMALSAYSACIRTCQSGSLSKATNRSRTSWFASFCRESIIIRNAFVTAARISARFDLSANSKASLTEGNPRSGCFSRTYCNTSAAFTLSAIVLALFSSSMHAFTISNVAPPLRLKRGQSCVATAVEALQNHSEASSKPRADIAPPPPGQSLTAASLGPRWLGTRPARCD